MLVLDQYNCAVAHSVYYGLVLLDGLKRKTCTGMSWHMVCLFSCWLTGKKKKQKKMKTFLKNLKIRTTLKEMGASVKRETLREVLHEIVTGPDMEHIPYEITEDMVYDAMVKVEELVG